MSRVTDMVSIFDLTAHMQNGDVSEWDMSHTAGLTRQHTGAKFLTRSACSVAQHRHIEVGRVTCHIHTRHDVSRQNGDISKWDVSRYFTGDISKWDVSRQNGDISK